MHWFLTYIRLTATSPECILKFLALPTLKKAQQSIFLFCFGIILIKLIVVLTGLILFTIYYGCDPVKAGLVEKNDQLVPFYVADMAAGIPGLTGLFISGVFCTGLSTLSASLNALSATVYQDFISKYYPELDKNGRTGFIIKFLVVAMGAVIAVLALMVEHLGPILPLAISVSSITAGSFLGLFTLGMLCPRANSKGALWGIFSSTLIVGWMFIGSQWYKAQGLLKSDPKYLSVDNCTLDISLTNITTTMSIPQESNTIFYLYKISHYYYSLIGTTVCIAVGLIVSYATKSKKEVRRELISPVVHYLFDNKKKMKNFVTSTLHKEDGNYRSIYKANQILEDNSVEMTEFRTKTIT